MEWKQDCPRPGRLCGTRKRTQKGKNKYEVNRRKCRAAGKGEGRVGGRSGYSGTKKEIGCGKQGFEEVECRDRV